MSEIKPTSAGELSKLASKIVQCTSKHAYRIRKMPLPVMATFLARTEMKVSKDKTVIEASVEESLNDPVKTEKLIIAMRDVLPVCIIEPKISATDPSSDTVVNVDDIPLEDQFELFGYITDYAGMAIKQLTENASFRKQSTG